MVDIMLESVEKCLQETCCILGVYQSLYKGLSDSLDNPFCILGNIEIYRNLNEQT